MVKKIVLWPYLPGQRREIIDDVMANGRQVVFFNGATREFELIDNDFRHIAGSIEELQNALHGLNLDEMHILHTGSQTVKELANMLKRKNISFIEKKETYV